MELASIISDLEDIHFVKKSSEETEKEILAEGPEMYTCANVKQSDDIINATQKLVRENYHDIKISVSMLNNFFECPRKWYFRNFLRLPEVKPVYLALGTAVHSTIEYILKSEKLPSESDIKSKINFELEQEGVNNENDLRKARERCI
jgi:ATP-dependent helicase/DNAse subunit B